MADEWDPERTEHLLQDGEALLADARALLRELEGLTEGLPTEEADTDGGPDAGPERV